MTRIYRDQPSGTVSQLRALRRNATGAEKRPLRGLRKALPDRKWRFQAPVGPFRADFLCLTERLVIEVDGSQHVDAAADDERRTHITREGCRLLRFWNNDVLENIDGVLTQVEVAPHQQGVDDSASRRSPSPSHAAMRRGPLPLPLGEEKVGGGK